MKVFGFPLGTRLLFGAFVPGCVWVAALVIGLRGICFLKGATMNVSTPEFSVLVGISFLVGFAMLPLSYMCAAKIARQDWAKQTLVKVFRLDRQPGNTPGRAACLCKARKAAWKVLKDQFGEAARLIAPAVEDGQPDSEPLVALCKKTVLLRSERLGKDLDAIENEINILAALPLPLAVLTAALAVRAALWWHSAGPWVGIAAAGLLLVCTLLARLGGVMESEKRTCLEMFLILADSQGGEQRPKLVGTIREGEGSSNGK